MAPIFYVNQCTSTQDESARFLLYEESEILAVYTFNQTKGKGQYGNSWESSLDKNIAYSLCIPVNKVFVRENLFNFYTAIAVRDFLANLTKTEVEVKWPNDIIIHLKKISGLLIEKKNIGEKPYYIIGIGLNVLQENFENLPKAGSLLTQTGFNFNLNELAEKLHSYLTEILIQKESEVTILKKVNEHLFRKEFVSVFELKGIRQNGIIKKVDEEGFLWVELENDGLQKFFHKEIELLY